MAKASVKNADFSGVKDRGNFNPKRVPEGDYAARIVKVEDAETKETKDFQYLFTIKLEKFSQHSYPYYCKLQENQLWKIRNLLIAAGINVPKKRMKLDPNKAVGKLIGVTMADDEYDGKVKSVIDAVFAAAELADGAEIDDTDDFDEESAVPQTAAEDDSSEDEAEEKPKKKKKAKAEEPEPDKKKKKGKKKDMEQLDISDVS